MAGAGKKKPRSGKNKARRRKNPSLWFPAVCIVVTLLTLAIIFYFIFLHRSSSEKPGRLSTKQPQAEPFVIFEEPDALSPQVIKSKKQKKRVEPTPRPEFEEAKRKIGRVAIVIDDMGYYKALGERFIELDVDLSFAFLPYVPHSRSQAAIASRRGRDVLLHLPLEPADARWDPGKGALYISMSSRSIQTRFEKNLAAIPYAIGVNNHMGSRFTQNREAMDVLLEAVGRYDLFFLDSMTSHNSLGSYLALKKGIRSGQRDVFLDNVRDRGKIKKQIRQLMALAGKKGSAIGIGHPHPETYDAIRDLQEELATRVTVVGVHHLMHQ